MQVAAKGSALKIFNKTHPRVGCARAAVFLVFNW